MQHKKYPLVRVTWNDAASTQDWYDPAAFDKPDFYVVETFGLLIKADSKHVVVALNRAQVNGKVSCIIEIPKGMVIKIETLRKSV